MASFLFLFALQIFYSFAVSTYAFQYFIEWHKSIFLLRQTAFLTGPLIYFYLMSFSRKNVLLRKNLFHWLPFLSAMVLLSIYYVTENHFIIWKSGINIYDTILILTHNLTYIILSILTLMPFHVSFRTMYSNIRSSSPIGWLQVLLIGFIFIWSINLNSFATYWVLKRPHWCAFTGSIFALTVFLFINAIMFLVLLKPEIYYVVEKYKSRKINKASKKEYLRKLKNYMENEKPYLNPNISLELIAKNLSLNPNILSQIINESFGNNFKGYINEFRIKESMWLLSTTGNDEKTILEILYEVGFNSKSVFNHQFKEYTRLTPKEFREQQNNRMSKKLPVINSVSYS
ncbi:MAG: AraC family transcriptional regulator [Bacteroidota bacterium]